MVLPPPRPKSPPELYGKRRELAKVVMLEREIGFLEEEMKSIEMLQPASSCIKEVADYVITAPEPLITVCKRGSKSCSLWKWISRTCGNSCFNMPCFCCCCCCDRCSLEMPHLPPDCCSCSLPKCTCAFRPPSCPAAPCLCLPDCNSSCCPDCSCSCRCQCWPSRCASWPIRCASWPTKCSCWPKCSLKNKCCYSCCCQCC